MVVLLVTVAVHVLLGRGTMLALLLLVLLRLRLMLLLLLLLLLASLLHVRLQPEDCLELVNFSNDGQHGLRRHRRGLVVECDGRGRGWRRGRRRGK